MKFFDGSSKTTTIRLKAVPVGHKRAWAGSYMKPELLGEFDVVRVDAMLFRNLIYEDAVADGFESEEELRCELVRLNPGITLDTPVYIYHIENPVNKDKKTCGVDSGRMGVGMKAGVQRESPNATTARLSGVLPGEVDTPHRTTHESTLSSSRKTTMYGKGVDR